MITETLIFLSLSLSLFYCAWSIISKIMPHEDAFSRLSPSFIVFFSLIVLIFEILGASPFGPGISIASTYTAVFIVVILTILSGRLFKASSVSQGDTANNDFKICPLSCLTLGTAAFTLAIFAASSITAPPPPTDAFLDHLAFPADWLQAGRISLVQTLSPDQATTYYPANAELVYLWLMLPFHDDLITGLLEPLSLFLCWLASCRFLTRLGVSRNLSMALSAVAACVPGVVIMTLHSGVDLFFCFSVVACAAFLAPDASGRRTSAELAIAGLSAGLAVGTKYVGIVSVIFLLPLIFSTGRHDSLSRHFKNFLLFSLFAIISGSFWYLRNIILTGSPLYPMGLQIGGTNLFEGAFYRDAMFNAYLHISVGDVKYFSNILLNILFGKWLFLAAVTSHLLYRIFIVKKGRVPCALAAGVALIAALAYKTGLSDRMSGALLILILSCALAVMLASGAGEGLWRKYAALLGPILILSFWFVNPYNTANNYRFMAPAVFFIAAALFTNKDGLFEKFAALALSLIALYHNHELILNFLKLLSGFTSAGPTPWQRQVAPTAILAVVFCGLCICALALILNRKKFGAYLFVLLAILVLPFFFTFKNNNMERGRYAWYSSHYLGAGWAALDRIKQPVTVAYAGNCSQYGLYGNKLKNKVKYVNLDGAKNLLFHDYEKSIREHDGYIMPVESVGLNYIFRGSGDYGEWKKALSREGVDILFVTREFYRGIISDPQELTWAKEHPENFKLLFNKADAFIFAVIKQ